jgi:hypothetical protein
MHSDINTFTGRLVEIGVLEPKIRIALADVLAEPIRDSRFPGILDDLFSKIENWHEIASEIRYTSDPMLAKTIADGVKLVYKFAKSNIKSNHIKMSEVSDYNTKLAKLDAVIKGIEQKQTVFAEQKPTFDLRKSTLEMLGIYITAIKQQRSAITKNDVYSTNALNTALKKFETLEELVGSVVDTFSKESAVHQKNMFEAINGWESAFAYGNFDKNVLADLDKAIVSAKAWSLAPYNLKAKPAKEGDYYTAEIIGTRTKALATTMDAVTKINQAISLIERAKESHLRITDTTRLEAQKAENDKEIDEINQRITQIKQLAAARKIDLKSALTEKENLENKILPTLRKNSDRLNAQILGAKSRRSNLKTTVFQIENVCRNFLSYKDDPKIINLFAEYVNFEALTNFLGGSKLDSNINDIVNLAAIEKITLQKFDEANELFGDTLDEQLNELEPISIDEENEKKNELSEEEMLRLIMGGDAPKNESGLELDLSDLS